MQNRRRVALIAAALLAALWFPALSGCAVRQPSAEVTDVRIDRLALDRVDATFVVSVNNPNRTTIRLEGLEYRMLLDGVEFAGGSRDDRLELAGRGRTDVDLPVGIDVTKALAALAGAMERDTIPYELRGAARLVTPLGAVKIPFSRRGELPVLRPPVLGLERVEVLELGLSGARLRLDLRIDNPNAYDLRIQELSWRISLAGSELFSGERLRGRVIPAHGSSVVQLELRFGLDQLGRALQRVLQGGDAGYKLQADIEIDTPYGPVSLKTGAGGTAPVAH